MSERGTFVTSCLYDGRIIPALEDALPELACKIVEIPGKFMDVERPAAFSGIIKSLYAGGERELFERWVDEVLLPALPAEHGYFTMVVMPEHTSEMLVLCFKDGRKCASLA